VSAASDSEVNVGVTVPVMHIIAKVLKLCGEPASLTVGSIFTSSIALWSTPTLVSKLLDSVGRRGLGAELLHSLHVGVEVVALGAETVGMSAPIPGALFAKKKIVTFSPAWRLIILIILDVAKLLGAF
jgi:hypothetical protein